MRSSRGNSSVFVPYQSLGRGGARVTPMAIEFFSANMATSPDGYEYTTILHSSNWGEVLIPLPIFVVERLRATVPHCHRATRSAGANECLHRFQRLELPVRGSWILRSPLPQWFYNRLHLHRSEAGWTLFPNAECSYLLARVLCPSESRMGCSSSNPGWGG